MYSVIKRGGSNKQINEQACSFEREEIA